MIKLRTNPPTMYAQLLYSMLVDSVNEGRLNSEQAKELMREWFDAS